MIIIRDAHPDDEAFVVATAERLNAFGPPRWRTAAEVVAGEVRTLRAFFVAPPPRAVLTIAEHEGERLGFGYFEQQLDYFTGEPHGHIGILAVTHAAEGQGAAKALIAAAERWARAHGYRMLTLNVFDENRRARRVYEHLGFEAEAVKYVKVLP
jgi:GNAT superfamily N-acetyltransferase